MSSSRKLPSLFEIWSEKNQYFGNENFSKFAQAQSIVFQPCGSQQSNLLDSPCRRPCQVIVVFVDTGPLSHLGKTKAKIFPNNTQWNMDAHVALMLTSALVTKQPQREF